MKHTLKLLAVPLIWFVASTGTPVYGQGIAAKAEAEYDAGHYANALALFERRAAHGDAVAAEMAGQMLYFGSAVYGTAVARDTQRAGGYLAQAARDGRPMARYLVDRINSSTPALPDTGEEYVPGPAGC